MENQDTVNSIVQIIEDNQKILKNYNQFIIINNTQNETFEQKLHKAIKNFISNLNSCSQIPFINDNLFSILQDFQDFHNHYATYVQAFQQDYQMNQSTKIEELKLKLKNDKKQIIDILEKSQKTYQNSYSSYQSQKQKYEKICKEFNSLMDEYKKSKTDANSRYNNTLQAKQEIKLKQIIEEVNQKEKSLQTFIQDLNSKKTIFNESLSQNYQKIHVMYQDLLKLIYEISNTQELNQASLYSNLLINIQSNELLSTKYIINEPDQEDLLIMNEILSRQKKNVQIKSLDEDIEENYFRQYKNMKNGQKLKESQVQNVAEQILKHYEIVKNIMKQRQKQSSGFLKFLKDLQTVVVDYINSFEECANFQLTGKSTFYTKPAGIINLIQETKDKIKALNQMIMQIITNQIKQIDQVVQGQVAQENSQNQIYQQMQNKFKKPEKNLTLSIIEQMDSFNIYIGIYRSEEIGRAKLIQETILNMYYLYFKNFTESKKLYNYLSENFSNKLNNESIKNEVDQAFQLDKKLLKLNNFNINDCKIEFTQLVKTDNIQFQNYDNLNSDEPHQANETDRNSTEELEKDGDIGKQKSLSKSLIKKFRLTENHQLIAFYNCALQHKILLQGKLYIFPKKICFHSHFNNKNLLVGETVLEIPQQEIKSVQKINVAQVFSTGISISTEYGDISFASFIQRDQAVTHLQSILPQNLQNKEIDKNSRKGSDKTSQQEQLEKKREQYQRKRTYSDNKDDSKQKIENIKSQSAVKGISLDDMDQSTQEQNITVSQIKNFENVDINNNQEQQQQQQQQKQEQQQQQQQNQQINNNQQQQQQNQQIQQQQQQVEVVQVQEQLQEEQKEDENEDEGEQLNLVELENKFMEQYKNSWSIFKDYWKEKDIYTIKYTLDLDPIEIYYYFYSNNKESNIKNNGYPWFQDYQITEFQDTNITIKDLNIQEPKMYQSIQKKITQKDKQQHAQFLQQQNICKRNVSYTHPVHETFGPKSCFCDVEDTYYFFKENEWCVEKVVTVSKAPMSDLFKPQQVHYVKQISPGKSEMNITYYCKFVKSSILKSKIRSTSNKTTKSSIEHLEQCQKKYVQQILNIRKKEEEQQKKIQRQQEQKQQQQQQFQQQQQQQQENIQQQQQNQQQQIQQQQQQQIFQSNEINQEFKDSQDDLLEKIGDLKQIIQVQNEKIDKLQNSVQSLNDFNNLVYKLIIGVLISTVLGLIFK